MKPGFQMWLGCTVIACGLLCAPKVCAQDKRTTAFVLPQDNTEFAAQLTAGRVGSDQRAQIWRTISRVLRARGLEPSELPRLKDFDASNAAGIAEGKSFEVASLAWDGVLHFLQLRLRCGTPGDCLPFLVQIHMSQAVASRVMASRVMGWQDPSIQLAVAGTEPHPSASPAKSSAQHFPIGNASVGLRLVERGELATLILKGDGIRMSVEVICLDRGSEGQEIRVRSKKGLRVFRARVVGPGILEAAF